MIATQLCESQLSHGPAPRTRVSHRGEGVYTAPKGKHYKYSARIIVARPRDELRYLG